MLPPMFLFTTFWNLWFYSHLHTFMHPFVFSAPLMKYCDFWHLNISILASMLARCMCPNWRSHARGVWKMENVIPMLGGKHIFLWSPCSVGVPLLLFSTPLRRECLKNWFPVNLKMVCALFDFMLLMGAARRGTFFDDLQKRVSHPAWGSRSWFHVSTAVLLRCESLVPTCTNVLPTKRGDYIWDYDVPYVICCQMKYH